MWCPGRCGLSRYVCVCVMVNMNVSGFESAQQQNCVCVQLQETSERARGSGSTRPIISHSNYSCQCCCQQRKREHVREGQVEREFCGREFMMANSEQGYDYSFKCIFCLSLCLLFYKRMSQKGCSVNCVVHFYPLFTCKADAFHPDTFQFFLKSFLTLKVYFMQK